MNEIQGTKITKSKLRLSLDCTEIIFFPVFGVFMWILYTVHRTRKYEFKQI